MKKIVSIVVVFLAVTAFSDPSISIDVNSMGQMDWFQFTSSASAKVQITPKPRFYPRSGQMMWFGISYISKMGAPISLKLSEFLPVSPNHFPFQILFRSCGSQPRVSFWNYTRPQNTFNIPASEATKQACANESGMVEIVPLYKNITPGIYQLVFSSN